MKTLACLLAGITLMTACSPESESESTSKIVNGKVLSVIDPEAMHTVAIVRTRNPAESHCTGTLISERHVVTASHCFLNVGIWRDEDKAFSVAFGLGYLPQNEVRIVQGVVHMHPDWTFNSSGFLNPVKELEGFEISDIAIIELPKDFNIPKHMKPAQIVESGELKVGDEVILAGYGSLGVKDDTAVHNETQSLHSTVTRISSIQPGSQDLIGYLSDNRRNAACFGDSGGPMFLVDKNSKELRLAGVTKVSLPRSSEWGTCNAGGHYTNIAFFREWVSQVMGM